MTRLTIIFLMCISFIHSVDYEFNGYSLERDDAEMAKITSPDVKVYNKTVIVSGKVITHSITLDSRVPDEITHSFIYKNEKYSKPVILWAINEKTGKIKTLMTVSKSECDVFIETADKDDTYVIKNQLRIGDEYIRFYFAEDKSNIVFIKLNDGIYKLLNKEDAGNF